ncbi:MAG TPA: bifunctional glycosyltransferase/class I SAM-dependent methyltransferase [Gaiellales bacterium]|nr:bifunctional glycosyltransferase/class I SAM-dependent methyltransferase [Gaiellales bacterium]
MTKVVITMPAYYAADTLERTVADIPVGIADELILVDDASDDETVAVARKLDITVYVHDENRGYGGNQKTCYRRALEHGADIVVMLHPDYQYDPTAVPLLIAPLLAGRADMTFGSRFAGLSDPRGGGMPLYRYLGNRTATTLENLMLGSRFTELHSGLRAYTRRCLLALPILRYSDDFVFDSQLIVDAVTTGQRVVEVPIETRYTKESSSISVARSLRYVAHSLVYCGRRTATRGRRGRRSAVTFSGARQQLPVLRGRVEHTCALCGSTQAALLYPANVTGEASVSEFSCTSGGLARHDDIVRCPDCGMISSRPADTPERIVENYTTMVDERYLSEEKGRRELFRWVIDRLDGYLLPGRRLLEVGSNAGLFLSVAEHAGWDASGVEPSHWAVETGRRLFGVDLEQGTVETLDAEPGSRDAVVMLDVLEHLVDPLGTLRRLRSLLHEEGMLALSTVNVAGLHARVRHGRWPWFIRPHLHYFTPETLGMMLHEAGFTMVEWRVVPRTFHASYIAGRLASSHGAAGRAAQRATHVVDPRVPVGWLGDVVFVLARPA